MILKLEHIRKSFSGPDGQPKTILDNLDLTIEAGDFIAVSGPSGSGKTTLLSIAGCLLQPDQGTVELQGVSAATLNDRELSHLRNRWIGFVFQASHLIPALTVMENILVPQMFAKDHARRPDKGASKRAISLLEELGIAEQANMVPYQLSLGQRRRVALARALINEPALILADEPTGDLDPDRGRQVAELLQVMWRRGAAVLLVTHAPWLAVLSPRQYRLEGRNLVQTTAGGAYTNAQ